MPRVLRLLDLPDHQVKRLGDVVVISSTGLSECGVELLGDLTTFFEGDLALLGFEIALVADDGDGNPFCALKTEVSSKSRTSVRRKPLPDGSGSCRE